jgi:penicillin-binding protein 2
MNVFRRLSTRRARKAASHEIDPEDVFIDSQNLSSLNVDQLEGQLERPLDKKVFYLALAVSFFLVVGLSYRLFSMQVLRADDYKEIADNNRLRKIPLFALRGTIGDRNNALLAWNSDTLLERSSSTETSREETKKSTDGIPRRVYTDTKGFAHLLGYVSYPKRDQSGVFWQDEYIGKDGVEKEYQTELAGVKGERIIEVTATREIESQNVVVYPSHGENVVLTIDKDVQAKLYERMEALAHRVGFTSGAGVIMDVRNGEILALTNYPEYDNNLMTNADSKEEKDKVADALLDKRGKFINRVVSGLFTPGSTVKPFFAYAALAENVITPEQNIYSSGQLVIKNKYGGPDTVFKDWKAHGYIDMRNAIAESSDEYFYQIGGGYKDQKGLGIARLNRYAQMFGFASTTGVDLPGEESGVIPSPEWKKKVFDEEWLLGNTYHSAIGQYGFQLTPLELVRAVASIANGGYLVTPHVLLRSSSASSTLSLNQKKLKVVQEGMRLAVKGGEGTAKGLNIARVHVAGKSGTAELGVSKQLVNSWISGYFPYEDPKYAFVVIMEKGDRHNPYGAVVAMKETLEWMRDNTDYTKSSKYNGDEETEEAKKEVTASSTTSSPSSASTTSSSVVPSF